MTHVDAVLGLIRQVPGLTDAEIVRRTGIRPHQQVNQICRRLQSGGLIVRERGPEGHIINLPARDRPTSEIRSSRALHTRWGGAATPAAEADRVGDVEEVARLDPMATLIVIPCSGSKRSGGTSQSAPGLCDALDAEEERQLRDARRRVGARAGVEERQLLPAWQRYAGTLYQAASSDLGRAVSGGGHVAILSGGYGAVLADEPIGQYDARFRLSWWPDQVVGRALGALARARGLSSMVAFLAASTEYAGVVRDVRWADYGVHDAFLLSPRSGAGQGAQVLVPRALGQALSAFLRRDLRPDWMSSDGELREDGQSCGSLRLRPTPPSTESVWPVTWLARSELRKRMVAAISAGWAAEPSGI